METKWMGPLLVGECLMNEKGSTGHTQVNQVIYIEVIITLKTLSSFISELSFST